MGLAFKCGLMEQGIKDTGSMTKPKGEVLFGMQMVTCMKENLSKIETMDLEFTNVLMGLSLKACGQMTCSMERDLLTGLMALTTKAIM
jgi:hypothetical protein